MTVRTEPWPPGAPAWLSLTVSDVGAATGFYGDLFGWDFVEGGTPDGRTYLTALRDGRPVAGIGQPTQPDVPAQWTVYLATDDAAAAARAATSSGGVVLAEPTRVDDSGTAALLTDPAGATVGLWQAGAHPGRQLTDAPGTLAWCELVTPDLAAARAFYAAVLEVTYREVEGLGRPYVSVRTREGTAAGLGEPPPDTGRDVPPHWLAYVAVTDVAASIAVARAHGGRAEGDPTSSPIGRVAVLRGPSGERLAIIEPSEDPVEA